MTRISLIAVIGKNREMGNNNKLLWKIPEDWEYFKATTRGHPVIMGRKTFDSILEILGKPLPERANIVITRDSAWKSDGAIVAHSLKEAVEKARTLNTEEVFIGGGAQIYEQALPIANRLYLTLVDDKKDADAFFPPYEGMFTKKLSEKSGEYNGLKYRFIVLEK